MSNQTTPLTELLSFVVDNRGKSVPTVKSGFPLIATNCIKHSSIYPTYENIRYVDQNTKNSWFRAHPLPNDIIFVNKGTPGRVCLVPDPVPFCFAQDMIGFRCDQDKIDYQYLFAVLRSNYIQELIKNYHVGLVIPHFKKGDLDKLLIPRLANRKQELSVGDFYLCLSKKIELNNRINAELEAMAKTLYDYWFVQFDFPDDNGKPYKTSGGKMEYNATLKREIPVGWKIKKISEIALVKAGGDKPSNCVNFRSDEYSTPIFSNGISSEGLYGYTDIAVVNKPSITVSARGTIGYSVLRLKPFFPIIRLLVLTPYQDNALKFLEETIKRFSFENSGSVQQQLTVPQISEMSVLYPIEQLLNIYTKRIWPLIKKMELIKEQNSELQQLRDWLLPLLMNGQVTVK
ncbi:restriction endonuclease subunit S [Edwardsiella tarda]